MSIPNLETTLKQLRLSGLAGTVSLRLQEAAANRLSHEEFLEILLQDELNVRQERLLSRRTKAADFHRLKTLEDFDWRFNPSIPRKQIYDLATGQFIRQSVDLLLIGPPGVGKTHLAQALGYEAIKHNFQVLYRSIFDLVRDFLKDEAGSDQPGSDQPGPVLVVDYGAQYAQLIARRVREARVYSEIIRHDIGVDAVAARRPKGIILSGGPESV